MKRRTTHSVLTLCILGCGLHCSNLVWDPGAAYDEGRDVGDQRQELAADNPARRQCGDEPCDGNDDVGPAVSPPVRHVRVPDFLPSRSGFHFSNTSFPSVPLTTIDTPAGKVDIGNADHGMCGGMSFAARDYYERGCPPPLDQFAPGSGPLFDYIDRRFIDSFVDVGKYLALMDPRMLDHDTMLGSVAGIHGRSWIMIEQEWPKIRADLEAGHPSPLGIIRKISLDPTYLGSQHSLLAYGYDLDGTSLAIRVYDSNFPNEDNISVNLDIGSSYNSVQVFESGPGISDRVYAFFRATYDPKDPPFCACTTPTHLCGASCRDLSTDPTNCGACGHVCSGNRACLDGICSPSACAAGRLCGGACINTSSDPKNCGQCGRQCNAGTLCRAGQCLGGATCQPCDCNPNVCAGTTTCFEICKAQGSSD